MIADLHREPGPWRSRRHWFRNSAKWLSNDMDEPMHRPMTLPLSGQAGFTLTEIMIAAIMSTTIIAASLGVITVSQKTARVTGQIVNTQATARNALNMITADLKLAGFGLKGLKSGAV